MLMNGINTVTCDYLNKRNCTKNWCPSFSLYQSNMDYNRYDPSRSDWSKPIFYKKVNLQASWRATRNINSFRNNLDPRLCGLLDCFSTCERNSERSSRGEGGQTEPCQVSRFSLGSSSLEILSARLRSNRSMRK